MRISGSIALVALSVLLAVNIRAQDLSVYEINRVPVNSSSFNDIAPVIIKDGLVFCSDRRVTGVTDRTSFDGRRLFNIFIALRRDSSDWRKPVEIKSERSALFNNGPLCFTPDGKTVYFTSETETGVQTRNRSFRNRSGIFLADLSGTELVDVRPFGYNNPDYDLGQPSISNDGRFLFFASDMPGGLGGSDIYFCESVNGEWSAPVNLGTAVNSPGAENYPFMHNSGKLFFTSDRQGGLGGLDIYYSVSGNGLWESPVRLAEPVNSAFDDFAFVAETDLLKGYFSSNRRRNDDIYEFHTAILRKESCNMAEEDNYCYEFVEENAVRYDSMPFRYEWKFGDGQTGLGSRVEHCYEGPGTYIVQLDIVNLVTNETSYNEKSDILVIESVEQAYITAPDTVSVLQPLRLSADKTNLPGWDIVRYYWNFGDGTIASGKNVDKEYRKPGTYNIQLIVTARPDAGGAIKETCVSKNIFIIPGP